MRRSLLVAALALAATGVAAAETVEVWKSPSCGCCTQWVAHLQRSGFAVRTHAVDDVGAYRARNGVPLALGSCHTARVAGYAIEGHVPASEIKRLLRERPDAAGLAVPGMPAGSPGMEAAGVVQPYDVLLFSSDGRYRAYRQYR